jgi:hypothetical protein
MLKTTVSTSFFEEVWALEVDTYWPEEGDSERAAFVAAMHEARHRKRDVVLYLNASACAYVLQPTTWRNWIDIWEDAGSAYPQKSAGWTRTARRLMGECRIAL